jgi:amino acid transporter
VFAAQNPSRSKMRLLPLIAATYFMVSGGPYGIEDILGGAGYGWAISILLALPIFWSLPTALMIGELASAIPAEGGFYVWVRRALGPFWGYQESWLSLSASIFDMALYPSIFVLYLGKFSPALTAAPRDYLWSLAVVALCIAWNLRGAPRVGTDSVWIPVLPMRGTITSARRNIFDCFVASGSYTFAVLAGESVSGTGLIRFASPLEHRFPLKP